MMDAEAEKRRIRRDSRHVRAIELMAWIQTGIGGIMLTAAFYRVGQLIAPEAPRATMIWIPWVIILFLLVRATAAMNYSMYEDFHKGKIFVTGREKQ